MNYKDAVIEAVIEGMKGIPEDMIAAFIPPSIHCWVH